MFRRQNGFTLLEILIVLAIAATWVTLATPTLGKWIERDQSTVVMQRLMSAIALTRQAAILRQATVTLCPSHNYQTCSSNWGAPWMVFIDENADRTRDAQETTVRLFSQSANMGTLTWKASGNRPYLRYKADGRAMEFGSFQYCPRQPAHYLPLAKMITINMAGRPIEQHHRDKHGVITDSRGDSLVCAPTHSS